MGAAPHAHGQLPTCHHAPSSCTALQMCCKFVTRNYMSSSALCLWSATSLSSRPKFLQAEQSIHGRCTYVLNRVGLQHLEVQQASKFIMQHQQPVPRQLPCPAACSKIAVTLVKGWSNQSQSNTHLIQSRLTSTASSLVRPCQLPSLNC
jgi:hypothetical protein